MSGDLLSRTGAGGATAARPLPPLTDAHVALRAEMRAFVAAELAPHAAAWEAARSFPDSALRRCCEAGWVGLKFPAELGGGGDPVGAAVFAEELARSGSGGLGAGIGAHAGIALPPVWKFGTPDQHERFLTPGIRGEKIAALGITEPDAGSDVAALRTRAERVDGGFVVNGAKLFITNGMRADFVVTAVRTKPEGGHGGISFLLIERGEGFASSPIEKLGWHASDTAELAFDDIFVPEENLLGELHGGFKLIMVNFAWERLMMSLGALGAVELVLERTVDFLRARAGRGTRVSQSSRHRVAEVATTLEVGRALTYHALRLHLAGADCVREVTMAKLATQRAAYLAADSCLQVHFDAGEHAEPLLECAVRDLRLGPIGGGTDEVMKEILGKTMGL
ncbi:acyl-CoA dehydrogenase family protein [Conexibacter stalactiti]|uniref:Acyl-CoA dehydrogenase family protein n=1 Tax=Conexibacter stalactiti TaxID=1940611 RepID=A0ABU4HM62_9ACTN|nr:acyl-CoA dehydrogenase family protein [Conexibacter stalactiti]MDW5594398.1 acyl-CoA dehydrogenase family protein [Conexibacter stalactiti]MEC5035040.1 acyl-CoA dehydrogenase family protein [Conexibacter stalactiti]